jgi:hypothetical protein
VALDHHRNAEMAASRNAPRAASRAPQLRLDSRAVLGGVC